LREDVKLQAVLRRAMARAGIVLGYEHRCSKHGCKHREKPDNSPRRCPEHDVLLWPVPLVRRIRFHDLRHSTASNLMPAGVSVPVVQRLMRHRDPRLTMDVYGHLSPGYVLREIDKVKLGIAPTDRLLARADAANYLAVSIGVVEQLAAGCAFRVLRIGEERRVRREDLEDYLQSAEE
jgi:excisionase family DNA binding protein